MSFLDVIRDIAKGDAASDPYRRKPGEGIPEVGPVPLGGKKPPIVPEEPSPALGGVSDTAEHDWTALVDPRQQVAQPEKNPFTELSPRHLWIKDEMAKGRKEVDDTDWYFSDQNIKNTPREIYETEMGKAMADKAADEALQQQAQANPDLATRLRQAGVTSVATHPVMGTPVFLDANGQPVHHEAVVGPTPPPQDAMMPSTPMPGQFGLKPGQTPAQGEDPYQFGQTGTNSANSANSATTDIAGGDGGFLGEGELTPDGHPTPEDVKRAIETVKLNHHEFQDPQTQAVLKKIDAYLQSMPTTPQRAKLHHPDLIQAIITLGAAAILPKNVVSTVLSMPFIAMRSQQEEEQARLDAQHADAVTKWRSGLGLLDNELSVAQQRDRANYQDQIHTDEFNAEQENKQIQREDVQAENRYIRGKEDERKKEHDKVVQAGKTKQQLSTQFYNIWAGPNASRFTEEQRAAAHASWNELQGMSETDLTSAASEDSPYFKQMAKRLEEMDANVRKTEAGIDLTKEKLETQRNVNKWFDRKTASEIAKNYQTIAESRDRIRSRNFQDTLDLTQEERDRVNDGFNLGTGELKRLADEAKNERANIALMEGQLNGKGPGEGINGELAALRRKSKPTASDKARIKELETTKSDLEKRIGESKAKVEDLGKGYNDVAEDVKALRAGMVAKARGDADDRKIEIGPYKFDLGGKYVFGGNSPEAKDCSAFIQQSIGHGLPRTAKDQMAWLNSSNGKRAGFQNVTDAVSKDPKAWKPGDIWYTPGTPPSKGGSGYHVKVFLGFGPDGKPVFMEAKGKSAGVGTFAGVPSRFFGVYRPPVGPPAPNPGKPAQPDQPVNKFVHSPSPTPGPERFDVPNRATHPGGVSASLSESMVDSKTGKTVSTTQDFGNGVRGTIKHGEARANPSITSWMVEVDKDGKEVKRYRVDSKGRRLNK